MTELIAQPIEDDEPEKIDFNSPEDVIIKVIADTNTDQSCPIWNKHSIETTTVLNGADGIMGAASYEQAYGSFLDYTIEAMIDCPGEGWFVVTGITGYYHKGDGWMTDDHMEFYYESVRPATPEQILQA